MQGKRACDQNSEEAKGGGLHTPSLLIHVTSVKANAYKFENFRN
jgi:hypothetical protein